jgi:Domain of unknown function (DUF4340)
MKRRLINVLGVVLGLQVLLALVLDIAGSGSIAAPSSDPLLHFDTKAVTRVSVAQPGKDTLVLERKDGKWEMPALGDFPAAKNKVEGFLAEVEGLRKRFPVATSASAAKRFKVSPQVFEHKVVLAAGEKPLATLWLGDSPNFRRVYGRADGDDAVYDLELSAQEASADADAWTDKSYLDLKEKDITEVTLPGLHLQRKDGKWQLGGLAAGEQTNASEAESVARDLADLSFVSVLGTEAKPEYKLDAPVLTISVTTKGAKPRSYVFSKPDKGAEYVLKTSSAPYYFKVADFTVKPLLEAKREKLVKAPAKTPAAAAQAPAAKPPAAPAAAKAEHAGQAAPSSSAAAPAANRLAVAPKPTPAVPAHAAGPVSPAAASAAGAPAGNAAAGGRATARAPGTAP